MEIYINEDEIKYFGNKNLYIVSVHHLCFGCLNMNSRLKKDVQVFNLTKKIASTELHGERIRVADPAFG